MKTRGEVEAAVCEGIARFMQDFMGRGPKEIRTHLFGNLLLVRLQGILTPAEVSLAAVQPPEKGRDMLKSVRTYMLEASRQRIDALVEQATELACVSMHHDISTVTGEEVFVFALSSEIDLREAKRT
jgi:uncharacterized protein YbcI